MIIERFELLIERCLFLCLGSDAKCTSLTYKCSNNKCISKQNPECDGTEDCEDGSDEANCGTSDKPEAFFLDCRCAAATSQIMILGFALQTVERACSKRHVLLVARLPRKESIPGRSASTLKIANTSVERPSSVQPGWLLLLTACRIPAHSGSIFVHLSLRV